MKTTELSQFTNKELKDILKKNQVKNYSKLNKKDLIKKVNQLTNSQNGGGETEYTEVGGVRVPTHMLTAQRGQPPVQQVNIAQPPPPNSQRYHPPRPLTDPLNSIGNILVQRGVLKNPSHKPRQNIQKHVQQSDAQSTKSFINSQPRNSLIAREPETFTYSQPPPSSAKPAPIPQTFFQPQSRPSSVQKAQGASAWGTFTDLSTPPSSAKPAPIPQTFFQPQSRPSSGQPAQGTSASDTFTYLPARPETAQQSMLQRVPRNAAPRNAAPQSMLQSGPRNALQNRITISCPSEGWAQQSNDCWIDSAYYAMFVPSYLQEFFLQFVIAIGDFGIYSLKKFSDLSIEYLRGIDGNSAFLQKKQTLKKNILLSIREVLYELSGNTTDQIKETYVLLLMLDERTKINTHAVTLLRTFNTRGAMNNYDNTGLMNKRGNGDISIFFSFMAILNSNYIHFFTRPSMDEIFEEFDNSRQSDKSKPIKNYIIRRLRQQNIQHKHAVIIDTSYFQPAKESDINRSIRLCMNDRTVLQEILSIGIFSLEAVIRGSRVHYTVDFRCSDNNWYNYDNQRKSTRITGIDVKTRNWQGNDGLIFIFSSRPE